MGKQIEMGKFSKLALKNVFRNGRRTTITLLIIVFGAISLFVAHGFIDFSFQGLRERTIRQGIGHLQISHHNFNKKTEDHPLQYGITNADSLIRKMLFDNDIRFAMKRIDFQGLISSGEKSAIFMGRGIEPRLEEKLSSLFVRLDSGRLLSQGKADELQVIVGTGLAKALSAPLGEYLTILSSTTYGVQNALDVELVGTFTTGIPEMDDRLIMVTIEAAQFLMDTQSVSKIVVVLNDSEKTQKKFEELRALFGDYDVKWWKQLAPYYQAVVNLYTSAFGLLGFIIGFIIIMTVVNTTVMAISERTSEIATLLAIGASQTQILRNFLYESLIISLLASVSAMTLAFIIIMIINASGFIMPPPPGSTAGYPLYINILPDKWAWICLSMTALSILASIIPAYKASRLNIVKGLGHI